jgi:hypothetical protein
MFSRLKHLADTLLGRRIAPAISQNTFIVWEPCTHSHAEVLPGYVKYLLDLGFDVAVFATPARFEEGLFSRFNDSRITLHKFSQRSVRRFFRNHGLQQARGILITTARKISGKDNYSAEYQLFSDRQADQKLLLVEHDVKAVVDNGAITPDIITLRQVAYQNAVTTVINPHSFGDVSITPKHADCVTFITIGAMRGKRRNTTMLLDAVAQLQEKGIANFEITVIGRGSLSGIPPALRKHFKIKGRINFSSLYAEMENADFFLPLLDPENPQHDRYITTGTSGSFQLIYGFAKPCVVAEKFAETNRLNAANSIIYSNNADLAQAMSDAIKLSPSDYAQMQRNLTANAASLYNESLENLKKLIA